MRDILTGEVVANVRFTGWQCKWDTPGFREFHRRAQLFILLYIEGGSYIQVRCGRFATMTGLRELTIALSHTATRKMRISGSSCYCKFITALAHPCKMTSD